MFLRRLATYIKKRRKENLITALQSRAITSSGIEPSHAGEQLPYVLVISHDANLGGAQRLLINLLEEWKTRQPFPIKVICIESGVLRNEFEALFPTLVLSDYWLNASRDRALVRFIDTPPYAIYSSTVVNGPLLEELSFLGSPIITHSHELQASIERWAPTTIMATTLTNSDYFLCGCPAVFNNLHVRHQVPRERLEVVYDFISLWGTELAPKQNDLDQLTTELGIDENDIVVFGCGSTDWRKGPDLFLRVALLACRQNPRLKFFWVGGQTEPKVFREEIAANHLTHRIRFIGSRPLSRRYYYAGHIFALTSREDPCPLAALEAAEAKLPVVCFERAGNIPDTLGQDCGAVVEFENTSAFAASILELAADPQRRQKCGQNGYDRVCLRHSATAAATAIETILSNVAKLPRKPLGRFPTSPKVTVIVPNYNHHQFLERRLQSIAKQSFRDMEIIILDDASNDASRTMLEAFVATESRARLICNEFNSGSTFKQWRKGLAAAQGKYVWIAESDDAAEPTFLAKAVAELESDSAIVVTHTNSFMIDSAGNVIGTSDTWPDDLVSGRWRTKLIADGISEIRYFLYRKNTIPNASAVVFRNFSGIELLVDDSMRLCGDWLFWIRLLSRGKYAYINENLNYWRQNTSNARSEIPGVLEWDEGKRILHEVAAILNLPEVDHLKIVEEFRQRCIEWSGGRLQ